MTLVEVLSTAEHFIGASAGKKRVQEDKRKGMKKTIYILLPLITFRVSHDIIQLLLYFIVDRLVGLGEQTATLLQENSAYVTSAIQILDMSLALAVTCWVDRYYRLRNAYSGMEQSRLWRKPSLHLGMYFAKCILVFAGFAVFLNCLLLQLKLNRFSAAFDATSQSQSATPAVMAVLVFGIISPLVEEYVFRYFLYNRMKCYFSAALSIVTSALLFGIYHANLVQGIYAFFMGLYLAYCYECLLITGVDEKKGIWVPIICHGIANVLVFFGGHVGLFMTTPMWAAILLFVIGMIVEVIYYKKYFMQR